MARAPRRAIKRISAVASGKITAGIASRAATAHRGALAHHARVSLA